MRILSFGKGILSEMNRADGGVNQQDSSGKQSDNQECDPDSTIIPNFSFFSTSVHFFLPWIIFKQIPNIP